MARSNRFILHPWLPIDVRWPAFVGVVGTATYLYLEQTGQVDQASAWVLRRRKSVERGVESVQASVTSAWDSAQIAKWLPQRGAGDAKEMPADDLHDSAVRCQPEPQSTASQPSSDPLHQDAPSRTVLQVHNGTAIVQVAPACLLERVKPHQQPHPSRKRPVCQRRTCGR
jgi:hypothetical protein